MATLSSAGIGSGLDVAGIVQKLMSVERQPLTTLQTATKRTQDQLSAYGKLESAMTALRDAARKLTDTDTWTATTVASAKTEAVTATSDGNTPAGTYSVNVTKLAAAQTLASQFTFGAGTDPLGGGSLTIELGSWNAGQTAFTAKPDTAAITLRIDPPNDSLEDVRDAINGAGVLINGIARRANMGKRPTGEDVAMAMDALRTAFGPLARFTDGKLPPPPKRRCMAILALR